MTDMKKLIRETLVDKNALFFSTGGVAAAVIATANVTLSVLCAAAVLAAVAVASVLASLASKITSRIGVLTVYIAVASGIMASLSALFSWLADGSADTLRTALLLASVGGTVLSCVPKKDEPISHSAVRASLTATMYAMILVLLALLRSALSRLTEFALTPAAALILIGFIIAAVNFVFVSIAEHREKKVEEVAKDA